MLCATYKNFHRIELNRWCDRVLNIYNFTQSESISTYHQKNLRREKFVAKVNFKKSLSLIPRKRAMSDFLHLGLFLSLEGLSLMQKSLEA